ncbi:GNAT family N-acetyltransferase [Nocardioides dongkuii]|uniref:GNAT family N-acetyltransferase n=1 Tax=Nocardioides dongkuii TaxID=2760089 RepID=UPI0015FC07A7|nr:GNAT family N-acetyltransferase [Nocardioides dongkuii]
MDAEICVGPDIEVHAVAPTSAPAEQALRAYLHDVASRYYGRPARADELESALSQHPSEDLVPPDGVFLVATAGIGVVCGCVALARVTGDVGEVRRLHVAPNFRRRGLGRRLMSEVEQRARSMGLVALRLDTRGDLVESQRLYESLGYHQTPAHSGGPFSDRWYGKTLR